MFLEAKMESFATFNFDILAIIVFIAGLLFGSYYGFGRQLRKTINLILPFLILHFSLKYIVNLLLKFSFINHSKEKVFLWLGKIFTFGKYENVVFSIVVGIILYFLLYLIIGLIIKLFSPSKEKIILKKTAILSRIFGAVLSIVNTYVYLVLLLFALGTTMMSNISKPLANVMAKTSIEIFDISTLHVYQNDNVQKYEAWSNALAELTGTAAAMAYQDLADMVSKFTELNIYFKDEMLPNLSLASQNRIGSALIDDNYVLTLMEMGEKKPLFHYILLDEEENALYDEFHEKYEYLLTERGYVYFLYEILENSFTTYTFDEIFSVLKDNKDEILTAFMKESDTIHFINSYNSMAFFYNNHEDLYQLSKMTMEDYTIDEYVATFNDLFLDPALTKAFIEEFSIEYTNEKTLEKSEYDQVVLKTISEAFKTHQRYEENISLIDVRISYPSRLVLGQNYQDFFSKHIWENEILLSSYFSDTLSSPELAGYDLYFEYVAFEYILKAESALITMDDISEGLIRMKDLANSGIITDSAKYGVLEKIFMKDTGLIFELLDRNLLAENLISDILDAPTIDSEIKVYLTN